MRGRTVVAISSHVMRGAVGLRAVVFALERRGATVWPVPTVLLPWHPGLGPSTRSPNADLPAHLADLAQHAGEVDAVLTGYFASAAQVEAAAGFIDAVRAVRPDAVVLVDPVTGDERGRYVPDEVAEAIRLRLMARADILTPNANELADLGGTRDPVEAAAATGARTVVVTSALSEGGRIGTLLIGPEGTFVAAHERIEPAPRGTGDLFSAVYLSARLGGTDVHALEEAAAATLAVVKASDGTSLALATAQDAIAAPPRAAVSISEGYGIGEPLVARVHGVDGCRSGWAVVSVNATGPLEAVLSFCPALDDLVASGEVMAIDIPIGLPDRIVGPGRAAEQAVRDLLGPRQSSVFSIPARPAVYAPDYAAACAAALEGSEPPRKVSQQGFQLFPKIRELDALVTPQNQSRIFECHAEVAFWRLNGDCPMPTAKRVKSVPTAEGLAERIELLAHHGIARDLFERRPQKVPLIDAVDAAAIALVARRCADGTARPFPDPPDADARGLRIAIWA